MQKIESDYFEQFKKSTEYEAFKKSPVAYFCAEYALESGFPSYAGGLGILSGDYIRVAGKQRFPLLAVGIRYQRGQSLPSKEDKKSNITLTKVVDKDGKDILILIPIEHRDVHVKAWHWQEGDAEVYLLDTDIEENNIGDRGITKNLYDMDRDIRLKQEIILGIGGFRLLAALGYHASVYHLNEGHSAFLALELIRHEMEHQKVNFKEACEYAKQHILFTNHTLALAGQEKFAPEKVAQFIEMCAKDVCLDGSVISDLGLPASDVNMFSMTTFSFRLSSKANTVSKIHYDNAQLVWPGQAMDNVTNGIFIDRWDKIGNSTENILSAHLENKRKLLSLVKERTGQSWGENDLVFVWARRLVEYKQPLFLFSDIEKLVEIFKNSPVPIRMIFAGPNVPNDNHFQDILEGIFTEKLPGSAVFIDEYNIDLSQIFTSGADVWLNTPMIGTEACGTSGMKAALNGALSLSTSDGWINEVNHEDVGWVTHDSSSNADMLRLIQDEVIPAYAEHLENPNSSLWSERMIRARRLILEQFPTTRMLREYIEKLYLPILAQKHNHRVE